MKALSIRQPWLYCISDLDKPIENRSWKPPDYILGERIALHASKKLDDMRGRLSASDLAGFDLSTKADEMPLGAIVATAVVVGWIGLDTKTHRTASNKELQPFWKNKWFMGRDFFCYGWILDEAQKLPKPLPCLGRLGLWEVPEHLELAIKEIRLCEYLNLPPSYLLDKIT